MQFTTEAGATFLYRSKLTAPRPLSYATVESFENKNCSLQNLKGNPIRRSPTGFRNATNGKLNGWQKPPILWVIRSPQRYKRIRKAVSKCMQEEIIREDLSRCTEQNLPCVLNIQASAHTRWKVALTPIACSRDLEIMHLSNRIHQNREVQMTKSSLSKSTMARLIITNRCYILGGADSSLNTNRWSYLSSHSGLSSTVLKRLGRKGQSLILIALHRS